jgi:hypothetical protein
MSLSYNETKRLFDLIWPDVTEEVNVWIEQLRIILEDSEDETTLKDIHQAQGSLRALRNVLELPQQLLANKLSDEEIENERREDDSNPSE